MERPSVVGFFVVRVKTEGTVLTDDTLLGNNTEDSHVVFFSSVHTSKIKNFLLVSKNSEYLGCTVVNSELIIERDQIICLASTQTGTRDTRSIRPCGTTTHFAKFYVV